MVTQVGKVWSTKWVGVVYQVGVVSKVGVAWSLKWVSVIYQVGRVGKVWTVKVWPIRWVRCGQSSGYLCNWALKDVCVCAQVCCRLST